MWVYGRSRLHFLNDPASLRNTQLVSCQLQHPSFTNLRNGCANDSEAARTSESSNFDTANTITSAAFPCHDMLLIFATPAPSGLFVAT